jgi:neutral ceramidase
VTSVAPYMRAGCAQTVITPPLGISLAGFGARKEGARGVHDDLHARALVLGEGEQRIALVICDLCEVDVPFVAEVRRRVETAAGIPSEHVMVAATHTHAAPATFALFSSPPDPGWLRGLADRLADAVAEASRRVVPAALALGLGREDTVARNRRRTDGPVDPTVTVLRVERDGMSPAVLVHYACHPTVLGPDNFLTSRDYVGFLIDAVEHATGGWAMFLNGACGDVNVGHSAERSALGLPIPGRTFERAEALGLRIAEEALRALDSARPLAGARKGRRPALSAGHRTLVVPLRRGPSPAEAEDLVRTRRCQLEALEQSASGEDAMTAARGEAMYAELARDWVVQLGPATEETVEVQAFTVGDVALVALPGEFFAESGLRLRKRSPFQHTIVIGYANGGIGYVPPASAYAEASYETRLAQWSRVAPEAESLIIEATVKLLADLE